MSDQRRNLSDNWEGGGVVYSYIRAMPDGLLFKSIQIKQKSVKILTKN